MVAAMWILLIALIVVTMFPLARAFMLRRSAGASVAAADMILLGAYGAFAIGVLAYWTVFDVPSLPPLSSSAASAPDGEGGGAGADGSLPQDCAEAQTAIAQLIELGQGAFRQDRPGELLIADGLWEQVPPGQRAELIRLVARAACPSGDLRDQVVTIREMTSGEIVSQRSAADR